jgi:hypothetical protein
MNPQCDDYFLPLIRKRFACSSKYYPMTPRREMLAVWRDYDHPRIRFSYNGHLEK